MSILTDPTPMSPAEGERSDRGGRLSDLVWLTWRQHRTTVTVTIALIAVLTGSMLYVAARITTINQQCGNAVCPDNTRQYAALFHGSFGLLQVSFYLTLTVLFLPLLIGVFLGVPVLAREHEQRTLLLAWSQDITPQRWLWTKLALLAGLTAALSAAVAAACDHLTHVLSIAADQSLFSSMAFQVTGMLPLTLSVVWLALGAALGAAMRRTLPAVFTALVGYIALYFLVQWRYPTFRTPLTDTMPVSVGRQHGVGYDPNSLRVNPGSGELVDAAGHQLSPGTLHAICPPPPGAQDVSNQCLVQHNIYNRIEYQPGNRIPEFHLILTAGYLAIGAIAVAAIWWLVRRTSLSAG